MTQSKNNPHPYIIGVTGITGSGTSTVSNILKTHGGFVISADRLAHEVMAPGENAYAAIVAHFGEGILTPQGEIHRKALGQLVFGNPQQLAALEGMIHPHVIAKTLAHLRQNFQGAFAVLDAPLLIEAGMHTICNQVWLVTASDATRIQRIMARDGIDAHTATRRLNSRKGDDFLRPFAHEVLVNEGSIDTLRPVVAQLIDQKKKEKHI